MKLKGTFEIEVPDNLFGPQPAVPMPQPAVPDPTPPVVPTPVAPGPAPVSPSVPSGWTVRQNPLTDSNAPGGTPQNAPLDIVAGHTHVFTAPPNTILAFAINYDDARFAQYAGASIGFAEAAYNRTQRDVAISEAPGDMTPLRWGGMRNFQEAGTLSIVLDRDVPGACHLERNKTYWLNIKACTEGVPSTVLIQPFPQ